MPSNVQQVLLALKSETSIPTVVAAGTVAADIGAIEPGLPAGVAVNDILIMAVETNNQTITVSGWTEVSNLAASPAGQNTKLFLFWRRATGTDATLTSDSGDHQIGRIIAVRGCVTSGDPWNITVGGNENTADTSVTIPGETTTVANCLIIAACCHGSDATVTFSSWTNANLSDLTEYIDDSTTDGTGGGIALATGGKAVAGAYGDTTVTASGNIYKCLWSGALKPAGS